VNMISWKKWISNYYLGNDGFKKDFFADHFFGGSSSVVERQPSKLRVAGSNPVSRSRIDGDRSNCLSSLNGLSGLMPM
jgi:hypothetical protein